MFAYVTLVTNADYGLGALALARSLLAVDSQWPLIVLATESAKGLDELAAMGCQIVEVKQPSMSSAFRERHARPQLHKAAPFSKGTKPSFHDPLDNFCKLRLWELPELGRVVFLDADTLVIKNIDRLFGFPEFSAAPNLYENLADMHRLNSGVFVAAPNRTTFETMCLTLDAPNAFWRRTDQTFLEQFFPQWHGLPYTFNTLQYLYFNLPQLWHWPSIHVVHYQYEKPWEANHPRRVELAPLIDLWHQVLDGKPIPANLVDPPASPELP